VGTVRYYTMKEVMEQTGIKSKGTLVRLEAKGVIPKPKRRARDDARLYTQDHIDKLTDYWTGTKEPSEEPPKKRQRGGG